MIEPRTEAEKFWDTHCGDCWHDLHPMNVCATIVGGDQNGPDYCSCTLDYQSLAAEYQRTKAEAAPLDELDVERLARADFEVHELRRNNEKWADLPEDGYKEWWRDHARGILAALREGETK